MSEQATLFPLEFHVAATPVSLQASGRSRARWIALVREAARERKRETDELGFLDSRPLALTIYYFPPAAMAGDIDNIVKPIVDAMIHLAYLDDRDIERVIVQKFEPDADWEIVDPSDHLAAALDACAPVVYVRVDDDQNWRRLR